MPGKVMVPQLRGAGKKDSPLAEAPRTWEHHLGRDMEKRELDLQCHETLSGCLLFRGSFRSEEVRVEGLPGDVGKSSAKEGATPPGGCPVSKASPYGSSGGEGEHFQEGAHLVPFFEMETFLDQVGSGEGEEDPMTPIHDERRR